MVLFKKDIDKEYSRIISDYISKGYIINTKSMGGSQGDICKIDLLKDNKIVRVRIDTTNLDDFKEIDRSEDFYDLRYDSIKIEIELYTVDKDQYLLNRDTIWNNNGDIIYKDIYYAIKGRDNVYTQDNIFAMECNKKHWNRMENRSISKFKELHIDLDKIIKIVNNKKGYKTTKKNDISGVYKECGNYIIRFNGKKCSITIG